MPSKEKPFENIVGKGENAGNQHFLLFLTMFSSLSINKFDFFSHIILLFATAFNLNYR